MAVDGVNRRSRQPSTSGPASLPGSCPSSTRRGQFPCLSVSVPPILTAALYPATCSTPYRYWRFRGRRPPSCIMDGMQESCRQELLWARQGCSVKDDWLAVGSGDATISLNVSTSQLHRTCGKLALHLHLPFGWSPLPVNSACFFKTSRANPGNTCTAGGLRHLAPSIET